MMFIKSYLNDSIVGQIICINFQMHFVYLM